MNEQQKLRAERTRLEGEVKAMHTAAENRAWTPEEEAKVSAIESQIQNIDFRLMAIEEAMDMPAEQPEESSVEKNNLDEKIQAEVRKAVENLAISRRRTMPAPMIVSDLDDKRAERDRNLALRAWFLRSEASSEELAAARRCQLDLRNTRLQLRAQSTSTTAGGYTIPQGFLAELESKRLFFNTLRGVSRVIRTETGNTLPFPTTDDTSNVANLTAENTAPSATDITFGQVSLGAYKLDSLVQVSNELLRDSGLDLANLRALSPARQPARPLPPRRPSPWRTSCRWSTRWISRTSKVRHSCCIRACGTRSCNWPTARTGRCSST